MAKHCLITGATGGLGKVLATRFSRAGYKLALHGRNAANVHVLAKVLSDEGGMAFPVVADLALPDAAERLWETVEQEFGGVDVLINNAAVHGPICPFEESDPLAWEQAFRVDFLSPAALCRKALPFMKAQKFGRIINLSGGGGTSPRPLFSAYATAKTAMIRLGENLALESQGSGVTINSIAPGAMKTALIEEVYHKGPSAGQREYALAEKIMTEGGASMENVAELCLFLASSRADGITGKLISAKWDDYEVWPHHLEELQNSDLYTLRRITGRDRNTGWGDK